MMLTLLFALCLRIRCLPRHMRQMPMLLLTSRFADMRLAAADTPRHALILFAAAR